MKKFGMKRSVGNMNSFAINMNAMHLVNGGGGGTTDTSSSTADNRRPPKVG